LRNFTIMIIQTLYHNATMFNEPQSERYVNEMMLMEMFEGVGSSYYIDGIGTSVADLVKKLSENNSIKGNYLASLVH
jgi:hypothetical protein